LLKEFFLDKFEYDFECNKRWGNILHEHYDDLNDYIKRSYSHILNVHHIWISRLKNQEPESFSFDILPTNSWEKLANQNYLQTIDFLEGKDIKDHLKYSDEEGVRLEKNVVDVLYHILNHSVHHRAQISRELRLKGIEPPSFNFIAYH